MRDSVKQREQWTKKREYILAVAENVVGLGNVWRFPYLCYKNGGGVFLLPYLFFAVLLGVPLFLLETAVGQYTQESAITCWTNICPLGKDRCVDLTSVNLTATRSGNQTVNVTSRNLTSSVSEFWERGVLSMSGGIEEVGTVQWQLVLCLLACWVTCYFCIWRGVRSTGKVVYITAVFPYIMLAILLVRGLTLPGAWQGVIFYLYPEPSHLADLQVWMEACAQVLFSYGVAAGAIITLGSYNKVNNNCYKDTLAPAWLPGLLSSHLWASWLRLRERPSTWSWIQVKDTHSYIIHARTMILSHVSLVFSGPGLAFIAFPQAVAMMPLPQLWGACFFIMLIMLGLDTVFTGLETVISSVTDIFPEMLRRPWRREILLLLFCLICFITQIPLTTQGGCVTVGWSFGAERLCDAVEDMSGQRPCVLFKLCWQYITPLICMVCFVGSFLDHKPLKSGDYVYPHCAYYLGWAIALSSVVLVPMSSTASHAPVDGTINAAYPIGSRSLHSCKRVTSGRSVWLSSGWAYTPRSRCAVSPSCGG
ncbi:sodium-and chloride-dependent betaine transporter-like [Solea senegalensis]|uniref:Transporter n=1 Tax=Solea senegalensis TaxID=28829 RepID=A0AAV6RKL7_SOLSE|nr:sodium-and chloride-dependent betaine transporter-like [Solea senegalensis]